jgi:hypothetical protein
MSAIALKLPDEVESASPVSEPVTVINNDDDVDDDVDNDDAGPDVTSMTEVAPVASVSDESAAAAKKKKKKKKKKSAAQADSEVGDASDATVTPEPNQVCVIVVDTTHLSA